MKKITTLLLTGILTAGTLTTPTPANASVKTTAAAKTVNVASMKKTLGTCTVSGSKVYYVKTNYKKNTTAFYKCTLSGKKSAKINSFSGIYMLGASYKGKLYVSKGNETDGYKTYTIGNMGKGKLKFVKKDLKIHSGKGKYMVGVSSEPTDVGPQALCVYNASTNKKQSLGEGYSPVIYGNKVYYVSWKNKQQRCYVAYNVLGSKKQHIVAKLPNKELSIPTSLTNKKVTYYLASDSQAKSRTLHF